jgi:hypothetical protein
MLLPGEVPAGGRFPGIGESVLAPAGAGEGEGAGGWRRERLFSGVAELLRAVARPAGLALVIDDVQWADSATLDFLTFVTRAGLGDGVTVVATCRSDEARLGPQVTRWLAHARGGPGAEEIRLGPLSRDEVAQQVTAMTGGPALAEMADELYARGEGNPFFTEQLAAAVLAGQSRDGPRGSATVPPRLAELLAARTDGCGGDAQAVLAALAVAGRSLTEDQLADVTQLPVDAVRGALRELAAARLLADGTADGAYRPRHTLLAEAVAGGLLPGERLGLHRRVAGALEALADRALAAEVASHWAAAGRATEELGARLTAAAVAERVFGYAEAAVHWQRAVELGQMAPCALDHAGMSLPELYVRATDALHLAGDSERAGLLAEEAYRRFADAPDPAIGAVVRQRAFRFRELEAAFMSGQRAADSSFALIEEALRLFEQPRTTPRPPCWGRCSRPTRC